MRTILTMPDLRFRLVAGLLAAPFLLYAAFFGAFANTVALLVAMSILILFAPAIRAKALPLPQSGAKMATIFLLISLGLMAHTPFVLSWLGLNKVFLFMGSLIMYTNPRTFRVPGQPKTAPLSDLAIEPKVQREPRDPATRSKTQQKRLARQLAKKKKK